MIVRSKKEAAVFALCSVMLGAQFDCGKPGASVVHRFGLPSCPDSAFLLPDSVDRTPYRLSTPPSWSAAGTPRCRGFKVSGIREDTEERSRLDLNSGFDVRLNSLSTMIEIVDHL